VITRTSSTIIAIRIRLICPRKIVFQTGSSSSAAAVDAGSLHQLDTHRSTVRPAQILITTASARMESAPMNPQVRPTGIAVSGTNSSAAAGG
jgi:hypothetical protein